MALICNGNVKEMMTLEKLFASEDLSQISYVPKYFERYKRFQNNTSKFVLIEWGKL